MKILFTGGGSGGHIFPIIAISREIRRFYPNEIDLFYMGPKDNFGELLLFREEIKIKTILAGKIRRYLNPSSILKNIIDITFKIPIGIFQSFIYIFFLAPDMIFSKGGFGSLPVVIAGKILGVPIFLHESDAVPGIANRFMARWVLEIFVSFPKTLYFPEGKMILLGNPIRREILGGSRERAITSFNISGEKPVILVLGGSQGAQRINDKILAVLPELLKSFELIHQCGEKNYKEIKNEASIILDKELRKYYHPFPFLKEESLKEAYAVCDLIISRAGSGSIFEIAALGKPSILIPLPESAQNHQVENAYAYASNGASIVLEEENVTPHFLLEKLKYLISHPGELKEMSERARDFSKPSAAKIIAAYIINYLGFVV